MTEARGPAAGPVGSHARPGEVEEHTIWQDRTRVFLQPIAAPSILGLFGLAGATLMVGAWQAGWYGDATTPLVISPFLLTFGGLAQFLAGMWSYRARDGLATAMHGMWGAFWLAFGLMFGLIGFGAFPAALAPAIGVANSGFGFWFLVLCLITAALTIAALAESMGLATTLALLTVGSAFTTAGFFSGATWPMRVGGWLFVFSALAALYTAAAMMIEGSFARTVLPIGRYRGEAKMEARRMEYRFGQPGVKIGQ